MFSREELEERRRRLLLRMEREALDAVVLFASKVEAGCVRYYTGYESQLGIQDCSFLVVTPGLGREWTLVTNAFWDEPFGMPDFNETIVTARFDETIVQLLPSSARNIGIAPWSYFPAPVHLALAKDPRRNLRDITDAVLQLRAVKSAAEIEVLKQVAAIADQAAQVLTETSRPGASERQIASAIEHALRQAGSDPFGFSTILCSGPRTANFIALPGDLKTSNNHRFGLSS